MPRIHISKLAIMPTMGRFLETWHRIALQLGVSLVLSTAASPQVFAASIVPVANFGSNPGNLSVFKFIPDQLASPAALVVVMHGCTENATTFAQETGWTQIANKFHFALALPQQGSDNNPQNCFNFFKTSDATRDQGEALSIKQMVDKMKADHDIDPKRVFVTGLSAGGGMTSVMLATYPDVFAGGGIVAGLAYKCATDKTAAFLCMSSGQPSGIPAAPPTDLTVGSGAQIVSTALPPSLCLFFPPLCPSSPSQQITPAQWGDFVRQASNFQGPFPIVSIWQGSADTTVNPTNATDELLQWTNVEGIDPNSGVKDTINGFPHRTFKNTNGNIVVETYSITGMSHGQPVDPGSGCGTADQFIIDEQICASLLIAKFWGLAN